MPCSEAHPSGVWRWQGWHGDPDSFGASPSWWCRLGLPPVPAALCASGPGAGAYVGAPNTCLRSTPIFPGSPSPRLPTPCTLGPSACCPLLIPLRFSCSPSPLTDHQGWYYYNPWLNLNPPPISCFSGGEGGINALSWHPLGPGAGAEFGQPKSPGRPCEGSPLSPPRGRCLLQPPARGVPRFWSCLWVGTRQGWEEELTMPGGGGRWLWLPNPLLQPPRGLVSPSLSHCCLPQAGVTSPLFFLPSL